MNSKQMGMQNRFCNQFSPNSCWLIKRLYQWHALLNMKTRLHVESLVRLLTDKEQLVLLLKKQYPEDIGVISAFFSKYYVKLKPGEAIYLGANEPHAYLCLRGECMATSDDVVHAGLTPKLKDIKTLCSILTYK